MKIDNLLKFLKEQYGYDFKPGSVDLIKKALEKDFESPKRVLKTAAKIFPSIINVVKDVPIEEEVSTSIIYAKELIKQSLKP